MFDIDNMIKYLPEIFILLGAVLCNLKNDNHNSKSNIISYTALGLSLLCLFFKEIIAYSAYTLLIKVLIIISSILILPIKSTRIFKTHTAKFNSFLLFSIFFLFMMINTNNYLGLYMNIEFYSICLYFLIDFTKENIADSFKYLITSVTSSLLLLLGISFLYGLTGSIDYAYIEQFAQFNNDYSISTYVLPYILIFSGLLFKLGMFPFGNWIIDLYNNIDTKITTYISILPKLGVIGALINILQQCATFEISLVLIILSIITGAFGIFYGFKSKDILTIMACSSYVNLSYIIIAVSLFTKFSISTILFYLLTYIFMNIGTWVGIATLKNSTKNSTLNGLIHKAPLIGSCFFICLISLLGFPISSGFISKIYLLAGILNSGLIILPVIFAMILIMVSSVIFYIRPINKIFAPASEHSKIFIDPTNKIILCLCAGATILLGVFPTYAIQVCEAISAYL